MQLLCHNRILETPSSDLPPKYRFRRYVRIILDGVLPKCFDLVSCIREQLIPSPTPGLTSLELMFQVKLEELNLKK